MVSGSGSDVLSVKVKMELSTKDPRGPFCLWDPDAADSSAAWPGQTGVGFQTWLGDHMSQNMHKGVVADYGPYHERASARARYTGSPESQKGFLQARRAAHEASCPPGRFPGEGRASDICADPPKKVLCHRWGSALLSPIHHSHRCSVKRWW